MCIHEGNANRRLASEAINISFISTGVIPDIYKSEFTKLQNIINITLERLGKIRAPLTPIKIQNIQNKTAAKYIKLLIDIEWKLREELNDN